MYLSGLRLSNYKSFKEADFKFSKITLLLGPNSGGKTSVLASILSCLQSPQFPAYFLPNGSLVETGDFREIVKSHRVASNISIDLNFTNKWAKVSTAPVKLGGVYERDAKTSMPRMVSASVKNKDIAWSISKAKDKYTLKWSYKPLGASSNFVKKFPEMARAFESVFYAAAQIKTAVPEPGAKVKKISVASVAKEAEQHMVGDVPSEGEHQASNLSTIFDFDPKEQRISNFWALTALKASKDIVSDFLKTFVYIGSYRIPPQRTYYHLVGPDLKVGVCGQNAIEQVLAWENAKSDKLPQLVKSLKSIGLAASIKANKLAGGRFEVTVKSLGSSVSSSIVDVGFGINQFLPVLVAELQTKDGSTVAVSQPETHLHPSVQAEVASHFVKNVKDRGFCYLVETHSEYLINRIRRHVVAGDLAPEDVAVYYLEQSNSGGVIHDITFEKTGRIVGAPPGFFTTYQVDVMNIAIGR
ncbi:MAG TPA: AAA family ATPase [Frateuria sp.]|uniref:DUF3696 domain-containing protein n=1 Tax=Frateuria sp. TaxID=2211372 RepID=UPI002D7F71AB|nr:AAA family ATPase [Frateuria sp.]HET6806378.1 AAA family ATPase [Frateuria sp.]